MENELPREAQLTKKAIGGLKRNFEIRTDTVEIPELNQVMELEPGQNVVVTVRQMDLSELVKINLDSTDHIRNLLEGVLEAAASRAGVADEVKDAMSSKSIEWTRRIDIVHTCLIDPKLTRAEVISISDLFPSAILKIFTKIMDLTNRGADVKKNSSK
jgi:hypothetical protein